MKLADILLEYDAKKIMQLNPLLADRQTDTSMPAVKTVIELADILESQGILNGDLIFWLLFRYLKKQNEEYGINRWEDITSRAIPAINSFNILKRKTNLSPPLATKDLN